MLTVRPISLKQANAYVEELHRHNRPVTGHKFSIGAYEGGVLRGVAICGRPIARRLDNGETLEVYRVCTDGTKNACSFLYGACARAARELGYVKILTYILESEPGTSMKASGWKRTEEKTLAAESWSCKSRPREDSVITLFGEIQKRPTEGKWRWEKILRRKEEE